MPRAVHTRREGRAGGPGNGRADKAQGTEMVRRVLRLDSAPKPADDADALALAICNLWRGAAESRLHDAVVVQLAAQRQAAELTAGSR